MRKQGSNLVTLSGLAILLILLLVSAYLKIRQLELLLAAALVLCLAAWLWARFSLRKISVEIIDEDCRAFPGQLVQAQARLKNAKLLPVIWLDAVFPTGEDSCIAPADDDGLPILTASEAEAAPELCQHFLWLMPHQTAEWSQRAFAVRRGVCRVSAAELTSGDIFGLAEERRREKLEVGFRFIVYPAVHHINISPIINNLSEMERASRGFYTDRTLINSIRDYRDGDSFKDINWRLLARTGSVQVNVHEKLAMRRVCLIADLESYMVVEQVDANGGTHTERRVRKEELEEMLSLIASAVTALNDRGVICSLVIPAYTGRRSRIVIPDDAAEQVPLLLTALAEIVYSGEDCAFPAAEMLEQSHRLGQFFMFSRDIAPVENSLSAQLGGLPLFSIVKNGGDDGADRYIISETELTAV